MPIGQIIRSHSINYHIYADDTQLFTPFDYSIHPMSLKNLELFIAEIRSWMIGHQLKINDDKTEVLVIEPKFTKQTVECNLRVGTCSVSPSSSAKNLGVVFDNHVCMYVCFIQPHNLRAFSTENNIYINLQTLYYIHSFHIPYIL